MTALYEKIVDAHTVRRIDHRGNLLLYVDRPSEATRAQIAPTGKLRAGMNLGNGLFTSKNAATSELSGVSVDLMRELASRLGVALELIVYPTPGDVADASEKGTWDVAILAIEQSRAQTITFSPAMTEIEATYVVRKDSRLRMAAEVDAPGVRIAAPEKAGFELYLTRTLKNATLIKTQGTPASVQLFKTGDADALAGLKPALLDTMDSLPDARMVDGNFMTVNHGLGIPRGRPLAAEYVKAFVDEMTRSGFIARSIATHRVKGLSAIK